MAFFNSFKYGARLQKDNTFKDATDAYANAGMVISFQHVPTGKAVYFKAFITAFNENYNSDWSSESVYGRADPIYMFKQTSRSINLNFKIPASTYGEAFENLGKVQAITQFLYPTYTDVQEAQTISQSPLVRLKVMNLARKTLDENVGDFNSAADCYNNYKSSVGADNGLLGVIINMVVNHNIVEEGVIEKGNNVVLPRLIDVAVSFNVIHEHALGWDEENKFSERVFPYGVDLLNVEEQAPAPAPDNDTDNDQVKDDQEADMSNLLATPGAGTLTGTAQRQKDLPETQ
jgi:hypothetical protein